MLESAIPEHLRTQRKCPVSTPPNYVPPNPAYCARFPTQMKDLVMAIIGVQYSDPTKNDRAGISTIKDFVTSPPETIRPSSWEVVSVVDKRGAYNVAVIVYWPSTELYKTWEKDSGFGRWWQSVDREEADHGWFLEVLLPTVDRFETVFSSTEHPEGAANMQSSISGAVEEHGYWGSMRDRLPAAQDDQLESDKRDATEGYSGSYDQISKTSKRIRIPGKQNLCVIRSGQDWSDALPEERKLYLETMHPVLIRGMTFLRDEAREIGCYANNLWDVIDSETCEANLERTFGLGFFDDMKSLEHWSKSHQTHLNIFGGFLMYAKKLNNVLSLRLFHEVYVLERDQQFFEYVGCHEETGMLNAIRT